MRIILIKLYGGEENGNGYLWRCKDEGGYMRPGLQG